MHNIWCIFTGDLKKLQHNTIACIVLIGLVIVPSLYAWFNIDASWDPYGNTGNLKVAVANTDLGYRGDLFPIELNLGEQVVSALRENHQLQWIITGEADAIEGVKRGEYYAALILPDTFSTDMMSLFSGDIRKIEILYYLNEKENAIAPKITDKGADAVRKQIDTVFTETVTEISLDMTRGLSSVVNQREGVQIEQNMAQAIEDAADQIDAVSAMIKSFSLMTGSLGDLLESGINLAEEGQEQVVSEKEMLAESFQSIGSLQDACENTAKGIDHALTQMNHCYLTVSDQIDQAFAILGEDNASFEKDIEETIKDVQILTSDLNTMKKNLQGFRDTLPDQSADLQGKLDQLISDMDQVLRIQNELSEGLKTDLEIPQSIGGNSQKYKDALKALIAKSSDAITDMQKDYHQNMEGEIAGIFERTEVMHQSIYTLIDQLEEASEDGMRTTKNSLHDLQTLGDILEHTLGLLSDTSVDLRETAGRLDQAIAAGDDEQIEEILSGSPNRLSSFLASPVELDTKRFYPIANYGSAMAPFYSVLAIWVGGIILVAMLKVQVEKSRYETLYYVKDYQLYLGRYGLFFLLGFMQSSLLGLGDLYFLGIQCEHPFYFMITCWFTSIVFVNIIYTLTVSFGDIGKAICVILLVMQVAGSGGTFPIEMTPRFFHQIYNFLPFTHSMNAMRECIAGFYEDMYWVELGILAIYFILSLLLGAIFRNPVIRLNEKFTARLEDTRLM